MCGKRKNTIDRDHDSYKNYYREYAEHENKLCGIEHIMHLSACFEKFADTYYEAIYNAENETDVLSKTIGKWVGRILFGLPSLLLGIAVGIFTIAVIILLGILFWLSALIKYCWTSRIMTPVKYVADLGSG